MPAAGWDARRDAKGGVAVYLRKECEELFSRLNFDRRLIVFRFMQGLLNGTEKEKPPADVGASTSGIQKNTHSV